MMKKYGVSSVDPELGYVLFFLLSAYFIKSFEIVDVDVVVIGWALVAVYSLLRFNNEVIFLCLAVYVFFTLWYLIGVYTGFYVDVTDYGKNILSFFFLTIITVGLVGGGKRKYSIPRIGKVEVRLLNVLYLIIILWSYFVFQSYGVSGVYDVKELGASNYLTVSDLLAMFTLSIIGYGDSDKARSFVYVAITTFTLALLGSRASLVVFVIAYIAAFRGIKSYRAVVIVVMMISGLVYSAYLLSQSELELFLRVKTLLDIEGDESMSERGYLMSRYLDNLLEHPACLVMPCHPEPGDYVHNILSVHQYLGLPGLLALIVIFALTVYRVRSGVLIPLLPLFAYALIQNVFFRSWHSFTFPIMIGLLMCVVMIKRNKIAADESIGLRF